jgi:hypothetical protein
MNEVKVDLPSGTATISAGAITKEALDAAHAASAHIFTGVCNTVGLIPALLGGGMGNQISLYGLGVDQILSARLVTAKGEVVVASEEENQDLFWGIRGAGHNFGIVSELKVKAYEQENGGVHWTGTLGFPGSKEMLTRVTSTIKEMRIGKGMGVFMIWARPPPAFGVRASVPLRSIFLSHLQGRHELILTLHSQWSSSTSGTLAPPLPPKPHTNHSSTWNP